MQHGSSARFGFRGLTAAVLLFGPAILFAQAPAGEASPPAAAGPAAPRAGGGGRGNDTEFGVTSSRGAGSGRANVTLPAVNDRHRTTMEQIAVDSYKETVALTQATTNLTTAVFSLPQNDADLRAKLDALRDAQLKWAMKVADLLSKVQASSEQLPQAAIDLLISGGRGGGGRGGGGAPPARGQ